MKTTSSIKVAALLQIERRRLSRGKSNACIHIFAADPGSGAEQHHNRWDYSVLPFFGLRTVARRFRIPIRLQHFGDFESAMIQATDSSLAAHNSNYGHILEGRPAPCSAYQSADLLSASVDSTLRISPESPP